MRYGLGILVASVLATGAPAAYCESQLDASLATFADSEDGSSFDIDVSFAPNEWWTLSAGAGTSESSSDLANLSGDALRASVDVHSQRFGIRGYYRSWSDSGNFESDSLGARAYIQHAGFIAELIAESRKLGVDFTVQTPLGRPVQVSRSFDGTGVGASVSYFGARWNAYVEGLTYDYDARLNQLIAASRMPNIDRFPRIQALVGSLLTLTQGALDHEIAAGIERTWSRSALRLEWIGVEDAIEGLQANSTSASYRYAFTPHLDLKLTLGVSNTETLGSANFAGLTLGLHR